jgi:hypothetical protein
MRDRKLNQIWIFYAAETGTASGGGAVIERLFLLKKRVSPK